MKLTILTKKAEKTNKTFVLNKEVFETNANDSLLRQAVHVHLANTRTGTAKAKNRAEVSGTGKKPWKNNKVSKARTGDLHTPIFVGGGVSHGPVPMSYKLKMLPKMQKLALHVALTQKAKEGLIVVSEDTKLVSTKEATMFLKVYEKKANVKGKHIIVCALEPQEESIRAFRNIPYVKLVSISHLEPYEVLQASSIVFFESGMEKINKAKAQVQKEAKPEVTEVKEKIVIKKPAKQSTKVTK